MPMHWFRRNTTNQGAVPGAPSSEGAQGPQTETLLSVELLYSLKKVQQDGWLMWGVKYPFITMCPQGEESRSSEVFELQWAIDREQDLRIVALE